MPDALQPRANEAMLWVGLLSFIKTPRDIIGDRATARYGVVRVLKHSKPIIESAEVFPKGPLFLKLMKQDLGLSRSHCFEKVNCFLLRSSREKQLL